MEMYGYLVIFTLVEVLSLDKTYVVSIGLF